LPHRGGVSSDKNIHTVNPLLVAESFDISFVHSTKFIEERNDFTFFVETESIGMSVAPSHNMLFWDGKLQGEEFFLLYRLLDPLT